MLYNLGWQSTELLGTPTISPVAQGVRDEWNKRQAVLLEHTWGDMAPIALPEDFKKHRDFVLERMATDERTSDLVADFDAEALRALDVSFQTASNLGAKKLDSDPCLMTKEVGNVYDRYFTAIVHAAIGSEVEVTHGAVRIDDGSKKTLALLGERLSVGPGAVMAIAGEYYGKLVMQELSQPLR